MQGPGKKRWFKLGLVGWISTTVLPFVLMGLIGRVYVNIHSPCIL